ncbi:MULTISPECIES: NVEALA domain-containing protein [Bacteroides]|jgi:hypothetical protein|uniref:NVEALA domain-containing protein n=1 Tax=Bacteroides TaxID=816 RepID=UPI00351A1FF9
MNMKKLLKYTFVAAFVTVAGYGIYTTQKNEMMSDLLLANVEALANDSETGDSVDCCSDTSSCTGDFCGTFYPANGTGVGIKLYYK